MKSILVTDPLQYSGKFFIFSTLKEQNRCFFFVSIPKERKITKEGGKAISARSVWRGCGCLVAVVMQSDCTRTSGYLQGLKKPSTERRTMSKGPRQSVTLIPAPFINGDAPHQISRRGTMFVPSFPSSPLLSFSLFFPLSVPPHQHFPRPSPQPSVHLLGITTHLLFHLYTCTSNCWIGHSSWNNQGRAYGGGRLFKMGWILVWRT